LAGLYGSKILNVNKAAFAHRIFLMWYTFYAIVYKGNRRMLTLANADLAHFGRETLEIPFVDI
jgi:hypothetical protein